jgi:deazaflavin-dependent oxidoreductase (nitroreductase family)
MARRYEVTGTVRLVNRLVALLNRFGLAGPRTYTLTTTGRKTGELRSTPVTLAELNGTRHLVAPYGSVGWVHNLRANPAASLRRRGRATEIRVTELGPDEAGPVLHKYVTEVKIVRPYFDASVDDDVAAFRAEAERHPVFRIDD